MMKNRCAGAVQVNTRLSNFEGLAHEDNRKAVLIEQTPGEKTQGLNSQKGPPPPIARHKGYPKAIEDGLTAIRTAMKKPFPDVSSALKAVDAVEAGIRAMKPRDALENALTAYESLRYDMADCHDFFKSKKNDISDYRESYYKQGKGHQVLTETYIYNNGKLPSDRANWVPFIDGHFIPEDVHHNAAPGMVVGDFECLLKRLTDLRPTIERKTENT